MKKRTFFIVAIISFLFVFFCSALFMYFFYFPEKKLPQIGYKNQSLPFSLTVFGRSTDTLGADTISIRFALFNQKGEIITQMERSLRGWDITIDTIFIKTSVGWLVFPFRLHTDQTHLGTGIDLLKMYNHSAIPPMYDFSFLHQHEKNILSRLFFLIKTEKYLPRFLGSLNHQYLRIRDFEPGKEYTLFVSSDGTLSLSSPLW